MKKWYFAILLMLGTAVITVADDDALGLHPDGAPWGVNRSGQSDSDLPRVLLIGDSIVNGYFGLVRDALNGEAVVDNWVTGKNLNSGGLLDDLREVLAKGPYDVIHFNIGLHGWPEGRIPEGQYEPLLRKYVDVYRENAPDATLIWCSTTQISMQDEPTTLDPVNNPTIVERNAIAARVMKEYGIEIDDLYTFMSGRLDLMRGDKFHWKQEGIALQAGKVAEVIEAALKDKRRN